MDHPRHQPNPATHTWRTGSLVYTRGALVQTLGWILVGDFGLSLRDRAIPQIVPLLLRRFGATDTEAGLIFSCLPAAITVFVAPSIGYASDQLRSTWGRRIPFLLALTPLVVLGMLGVAYSAQLGAVRPFSPLLILALFWALLEIGCTVANLIFQGLVQDVIPTSLLGRSMGLVRAISLGAGIFFNYSLMRQIDRDYRTIFVWLAALYGLGFAGMCWRVREGTYPPPDKGAARRAGWLMGTVALCRDCFRCPYYINYFGTVVLGLLAPQAVNIFGLFYAQSLGMSSFTYGRCFVAMFIGSICLAYPLGILADRLHPLRLTLVALLAYALCVMASAIWVRDQSSLAIALVIQGILSGGYLTVSASLAQRLLPAAKFTEISSGAVVLTGLLTMGMGPLLGSLLDHSGHRYVITFYLSGTLALIALGFGLRLYRDFLRLGGPAAYQPPTY